MSKRAVARAIILSLVLIFSFLVMGKLAWGTEAPGCGNQHFRPRLVQCCPQYLYAAEHHLYPQDIMPPKCWKPLVSGFLNECCGPFMQPTPVPSPTCPPGWNCPTVEPTSCNSPTPWPTPVSHAKGECCREVSATYHAALLDMYDRYLVSKKALQRWRKAQMQQCREGYQVQPW